MWGSSKEKEFLFSHLKSSHRFLEYGSGYSTSLIAKEVKYILSMEHQKEWFENLIDSKDKNCDLVHRLPSTPYIETFGDGSYGQFKDYIEYPLSQSPFDIILIDGRARVGCASICNKLGHKNTLVFVHDFNFRRYDENNYNKILDYLELIEEVETMAKFKINM